MPHLCDIGATDAAGALDYHIVAARSTIPACLTRDLIRYVMASKIAPVRGRAVNRQDPVAGLILAGKYRFDFPLGEGGFGAVWRATELGSGRHVAVKVLKGGFDRLGLARFEREAEAMRRIDHPNTVRWLDFGYSDEVVGAYLVSEYVDGDNLSAWGRQPHSVEVVADVLAQIAAALDAAHRRGVVHRDLKPANVMLLPAPGGVVVKVLDFGVARMSGVEQQDVTKTGEIVGTPGFMSPEQLRGEANLGPATDLYSLGALAYELLTRGPVFRASTALEIAMLHLFEPAPPLGPPVPRPLALLVGRLLQKAPQDRPRNAHEVWRELQALLGHEVPDTPGRVLSEQAPPAAWHRWAPAVGAALFAFVVGGLVLHRALADPPAPVVERRLPAALRTVNPPAPPEPATAQTVDAGANAIDAGPPAAETTVAQPLLPRPSRGCGKRREAGFQPVDYLPTFILEDEEQVPWRTYLPRGYAAEHPHPMLVLFHGIGRQNADTILADLALENWADRHGVVLHAVFAYGGSPLNKGGWTSNTREFAVATMAETTKAYCIDERRIFLWGTDGGGTAAESIACTEEGIAGVITFGTRRVVAEKRCTPRGPAFPVLAMFPTADVNDPPEGGGKVGVCGRHWQSASIDEHERQLRVVNGCRDEADIFEEAGRSVCHVWSCDVPTVTCRLDGGRDWGRRNKGPENCASPVAKFPYEATISKFMQLAAPEAPP